MKGEPVLVIYCESCYKDFQFDTSFAIWAAYDKTNNVSVRTAKTDQPGHPPSLIRVFAVRMKKA